MNNIIEKAIFDLLGKLPYYGCLIQSMKLVISDSVGTAGVGFDKGGTCVQLAISPSYFGSLTEVERSALLIHEASHVDRLHLIRIPQATSNNRLGNIAADAAINCYIPNLPKGGIYPKDFRLKNFQSFEYYLARMTDNKAESEASQSKNRKGDKQDESESADDGESQGDTDNGYGSQAELDSASAESGPVKKFIPADIQPLDVHDWDNCGLSVAEQAEVIESTMERAIEKMGLDAGQLPSHVEESLRLLKELKTKQWHRELRKFLGRTVNGFNLERTWARRNRRFGLLEAGSKVSGQKKLAIAFDTSGSMSRDELERALAETMAMVKQGVMGTLIQFDTQINATERLRRNTEVVHVEGRGGTSFVDLMAKVDAMHVDGLVIFTDGGDSDTCVKPRTPVLWVYTNGRECPKYDWGFKTVLDGSG